MSEEKPVTFSLQRSNELLELLRSRLLMTYEDADAAVLDLREIADLVDKIYLQLIPDLLAEPNVDRETLQRRIWAIRDQLRFIDDYIHYWWLPQ